MEYEIVASFMDIDSVDDVQVDGLLITDAQNTVSPAFISDIQHYATDTFETKGGFLCITFEPDDLADIISTVNEHIELSDTSVDNFQWVNITHGEDD